MTALELRRKWIEALRSGDYAQTKGTLVRKQLDSKKAYCCLGVLCEVAGLKEDNGGYEGMGFLNGTGALYRTELPSELRKKLGLSGRDHSILIKMNDSDGFSFKEIADFIENKL